MSPQTRTVIWTARSNETERNADRATPSDQGGREQSYGVTPQTKFVVNVKCPSPKRFGLLDDSLRPTRRSTFQRFGRPERRKTDGRGTVKTETDSRRYRGYGCGRIARSCGMWVIAHDGGATNARTCARSSIRKSFDNTLRAFHARCCTRRAVERSSVGRGHGPTARIDKNAPRTSDGHEHRLGERTERKGLTYGPVGQIASP